MDNKVSKGIEDFLEQGVMGEESETLLRRAVEVGIPREDGPWLKSTFRLAATFLELVYGSKKEAERAIPWLLFSLGMAFERYYNRPVKG